MFWLFSYLTFSPEYYFQLLPALSEVEILGEMKNR